MAEDCPAPCCRCLPGSSIRGDAGSEALLPLNGEAGLAVRSPEAGRLLAETGRLSLRASGTCMAPAIWPGDAVQLEPKPLERIEVGEIAVFRRQGHLFGHRTIAKGQDGRGAYLVTRPDTTVEGDDGPAYAPDVLGTVGTIRRGSKSFAPRRVQNSRPPAALTRLRLASWQARQALHQRALGWLALIQQAALYRRAARWWFSRRSRSGENYEVQLPLQRDSPFYRKLNGPGLAQLDLQAAGVERWSLALRRGRRTAASLAFARRPDGCPYPGWQVSGCQVRLRYRGAGLEGQLLRQAQALVKRSGAPGLAAIVPAGAPAAGWFRQAGFVEQARFSPAGCPCEQRPDGELIVLELMVTGEGIDERAI